MTPSELKAFRAARNWTQRDLAAQIGKSERAVLKYEQDGADVPKAVALAVLAHEFNEAAMADDAARLYAVRARFAKESAATGGAEP